MRCVCATCSAAPARAASSILTRAWSSAAARVGADVQRAKLDKLEQAVTQLRTETGSSGWQARQDDVTGDAAELSGGIYQGGAGQSAVDIVRTFLQRNGRAFGLVDPGTQLDFPASLPLDSTGAATFRSAQRHQGIVVDGGNMLVPVDR